MSIVGILEDDRNMSVMSFSSIKFLPFILIPRDETRHTRNSISSSGTSEPQLDRNKSRLRLESSERRGSGKQMTEDLLVGRF